jgi:hypothetical protein
MTQPLSPALSAEQRAWSYWFADGLPTLTAGIGSLLIAFVLLYSRHRPATPLTIAVMLVALFLYGVVLLRYKQVVEWLKSKFTYPRTGYVSAPYFAEDNDTLPVDIMTLSLQGADAQRLSDIERVDADRKKRAFLVAALVLVVTTATMFIANRWICAVAGVVLAAALWLGSRKDERLSWIVLVGFPFIGFYMTAFLAMHVSGPDRVAYFLAGGGVLFVLEGAWKLIQYLRSHPRVELPQSQT